MENQNLLEVFDREMQCEYKDRQFLVRDNGAILRLPKEECKPSKWDNVWTFGTKDGRTGYMIFTGNIRVHQVVCTAFHGPEPESNMVVDHIDTNRCNNRPENLRWLTRLENTLNNEATRKKIIYLCGSIEAFIENPAILRTKALPPNVEWMRTVTKEEAAKCKKHIARWAKEDSPKTIEPTENGIGDWIFSDEERTEALKWFGVSTNPGYNSYAEQNAEIEENNRRFFEEQHGLKDSLTPGAKQLNWKTPTEFLLCPTEGSEKTLEAYLDNLVKGKVFTHNHWGDCIVLDCGINETDKAIYVLTHNTDMDDNGFGKPWALCRITLQDGIFIHENEGSFFEAVGGQKYFTLAMGRVWTGGEVFDDGC